MNKIVNVRQMFKLTRDRLIKMTFELINVTAVAITHFLQKTTRRKSHRKL